MTLNSLSVIKHRKFSCNLTSQGKHEEIFRLLNPQVPTRLIDMIIHQKVNRKNHERTTFCTALTNKKKGKKKKGENNGIERV